MSCHFNYSFPRSSPFKDSQLQRKLEPFAHSPEELLHRLKRTLDILGSKTSQQEAAMHRTRLEVRDLYNGALELVDVRDPD